MFSKYIIHPPVSVITIIYSQGLFMVLSPEKESKKTGTPKYAQSTGTALCISKSTQKLKK